MGLFLIGGTLAAHFYQVNATAVYTMGGAGGVLILATAIASIVQCISHTFLETKKIKNEAAKQTADIEAKNKNEAERKAKEFEALQKAEIDARNKAEAERKIKESEEAKSQEQLLHDFTPQVEEALGGFDKELHLKKLESAEQTPITEQEVIALLGRDVITKWKRVDLLSDFYYTFEDFGKSIYVLRYNKHGEEKILYFGSLEKRRTEQQRLETEYRLIDQRELEYRINRFTGSNYLHQKEIGQYKLNPFPDYYWPFELKISGQTLYCVEQLWGPRLRFWRSAVDRYEQFIKPEEDHETFRAQELIKDYKIEEALKDSKDYACFGCMEYDIFIFYKVDDRIKWQYVQAEGDLQHVKKEAGLERNVFGKKIISLALSYHENGYAIKLATDHKLQERINEVHDYAQFSDGGCIYLFYKTEGKVQLEIVGIDEFKTAIDRAGLKHDVLAE